MAAGTFIGPGDGRLVALSVAVSRTVRSRFIVALGVYGQVPVDDSPEKSFRAPPRVAGQGGSHSAPEGDFDAIDYHSNSISAWGVD